MPEPLTPERPDGVPPDAALEECPWDRLGEKPDCGYCHGTNMAWIWWDPVLKFWDGVPVLPEKTTNDRD